MIKVTKKFGILLLVSCVSISSFANSDLTNNDYDADYYENEGNLVFKIRGGDKI